MLGSAAIKTLSYQDCTPPADSKAEVVTTRSTLAALENAVATLQDRHDSLSRRFASLQQLNKKIILRTARSTDLRSDADSGSNNKQGASGDI